MTRYSQKLIIQSQLDVRADNTDKRALADPTFQKCSSAIETFLERLLVEFDGMSTQFQLADLDRLIWALNIPTNINSDKYYDSKTNDIRKRTRDIATKGLCTPEEIAQRLRELNSLAAVRTLLHSQRRYDLTASTLYASFKHQYTL